MFGRPVHTLQSATSGWRDLWLNTGANLSPSYSPLPWNSSSSSHFSLVVDYQGNLRNLWQTCSSRRQLLFAHWRKTLWPSRRIAVLQDKKASKSPLKSSWISSVQWDFCFGGGSLGFVSGIFLGKLLANWIKVSHQPAPANDCGGGVFIGGDPEVWNDWFDPTWYLDTCPQRSDFSSSRNFTCGTSKADSQT